MAQTTAATLDISATKVTQLGWRMCIFFTFLRFGSLRHMGATRLKVFWTEGPAAEADSGLKTRQVRFKSRKPGRRKQRPDGI